MFLKLTHVTAVLLIGSALTGCSTTSEKSSVYTTSTYHPPVYRAAPHTTIITKTKAYQGYKPKYAHAPSQNISVHQNQMIKNKMVRNKVVQNNTMYHPNTPHYAKTHPYHPNKSYAPATSAHNSYTSNAPYASAEQNQINEAKRRSLETKAQEDAWNNRLNAADEHQMQQAMMNSYETKAAEDAARSKSSWLDSSIHTSAPSAPSSDNSSHSSNSYGNNTKMPVESAIWEDDNRQLQQAMDASLQTQAAEDATRAQTLAAAEENRQLQQAMDASLQTQAAEDAARAQTLAAAEENRQLQQAMDASLQTQAAEDAARAEAYAPSAHESYVAPVAAQEPIMIPVEAPAPVAVIEQPVAWVPNDGMQVQAGEKLMELKRNNGGVSPSYADMKTHLQREMNLSDAESGIVLDELGIE